MTVIKKPPKQLEDGEVSSSITQIELKHCRGVTVFVAHI
jgi:hypothetical protein